MAEEFVRTPTRAAGGVTEEEKVKMAVVAQKWIAIALRTEPIEPDKIVPAIHRLYAAADLAEPKVVIATSPLAMALAGVLATTILALREANGADDPDVINILIDDLFKSSPEITEAIRLSVARTLSECLTMPGAVTKNAGKLIQEYMVKTAFAINSQLLLLEANRAAPAYADEAAATLEKIADSLVRPETDNRGAIPPEFLQGMTEGVVAKNASEPQEERLKAARQVLREACWNWRFAHQGGNMWAGSPAYYEAMRDVIGLTGLDCWEKYQPWEDCAIHGSFRYLHEKFCIVADFPSALMTDEQHRPHNPDGPSHAWRDGWSLYHWNGVRVPAQVILAPETLTAEQITKEQNQEVRRVMIERMGWERFCVVCKMKVIHRDELVAKFPTVPVSDLVEPGQRFVYDYRDGKETAELLEAEDITDFEDRPLRFVRLTDPSTGRKYTLRVPHDTERCYAGVGWTFGKTEEEYKNSWFVRQGDVAISPLTPIEGKPSQHS